MAKRKNNSKKKSVNDNLMYPFDIRKMTVTTNEGEVIKVIKWLKQISNELPGNLRYSKGSKKGQLVNHYEELKTVFKRDGKRGVKLYTKGCYRLISDANKLFILKAKLEAVTGNTGKPLVIEGGKKGVKRENPKMPPQKAKPKENIPSREDTQRKLAPRRDNSLKARRERSRGRNI